MEIQNDEKFIKGVENLINPMEVSNLLFFQKFKILLPPLIMKRLLYKASKKTPYIGFVIDPYSLFLFFQAAEILKKQNQCCQIVMSLQRRGCSRMTSRITTWELVI